MWCYLHYTHNYASLGQIYADIFAQPISSHMMRQLDNYTKPQTILSSIAKWLYLVHVFVFYLFQITLVKNCHYRIYMSKLKLDGPKCYGYSFSQVHLNCVFSRQKYETATYSKMQDAMDELIMAGTSSLHRAIKSIQCLRQHDLPHHTWHTSPCLGKPSPCVGKHDVLLI